MLLWLQQSDDSEETQSEEYDFEDTATDFGKLLFFTSVSSRVSSPDVLYSLGPIDEDIEIADRVLMLLSLLEKLQLVCPAKNMLARILVLL